MKLVHNADEPVDAASPLGYALRYAAIGWHVFPLWPTADGACACGDAKCKSAAKHPIPTLAPLGQNNATTDAETIKRWWHKRPDANIGVYLAPSRLCAIDIDPRNGGLDTIEALERQHGAIESEVVQITGGGGEHRVFQLPPSVQSLPGKLGPGVDVKLNGYIVAEPSVHISGRRYGWEAASDPLEGAIPSPLPDWLRDLAGPASKAVPLESVPCPLTDAQVAEVVEALEWVDADDRDSWLRVGMALHNDLAGQRGFDVWCEWSRKSPKFDAADQMRVWRSFKRRGIEGVTRSSIFAMAQSAGWKNTGPKPEPVAPIPEEGLLLTLGQLQSKAQDIRWLIKHIIPAASVGVLFGASGAFKSFVALDLSLHNAHGLAWCGKKTAKGSVVYVAGEGGAGLWRRIDAWHRARGLALPDNFRVCVHPLLLDRPDQARKLLDAVRGTGLRPSLVVIDTLSQTYSGDENDASDMAAYFRSAAAALRSEFDSTVLVVHHVGHGAAERPRGSSVLTANTDFVFGCYRTADDAMSTVLECRKQKDGDKPPALPFDLSKVVLGRDEDGDEVSSLVASYTDNANAILAAAAVRMTQHEQLLIDAFGAVTEAPEAFLRGAFYAALGGAMTPDAKRQAWRRTTRSLSDKGVISLSATGVWARNRA
jgi:hypothetical protein